MRLLPALMLIGCAWNTRGGLDVSSCADTATVISYDEVTGLGFSAADLVGALGAQSSPDEGGALETLVWLRDGSQTQVRTDVTWEGGEARFIDSVIAESGMDTADSECEDSVEVDVTLTLATEDGTFMESWPITVRARDAGSAWFSRDLDASALAGTFDKWNYADPTADYESLGAEIRGTIAQGQSSGEIILTGQGWQDPDCQEEGCGAWSSRETVASWGDE